MSLLGHIDRFLDDSWDTVNGGLDVNVQDQTTPPFQFFLMREDKTDITLASDITADTDEFDVSAGHGFSIGDYILITEGNTYLQTEVVGVSTNTITLKSPTMNAFTTDATVIRGRINIAQTDGSSSPIDFVYRSWGTVPVDVQYAKVLMIHDAEGTDGKFGDLTALSNGMLFRRENGNYQNYGVYKKNQDFEALGAANVYTDKAGGGTLYGTKITFDMKKIYGNVLRFDPATNCEFHGYNRDDLTDAGFTQMIVSLMGQFTQGEV